MSCRRDSSTRYNVPENYIVRSDRTRLATGKDAALRDETGRKRPMREGDLDALLSKVAQPSGGQYRAMASRLIDGRPIGPFLYHRTRGDDPNDLIEHEHRRDLRGLRTICAWLGHDDSRAINTLDVVANEGGVPHVKHYLIDFGATLGSASTRANSPRDGNVPLFDWKTSAVQLVTLGLYAPKWQQASFPALPSVGRFEYEVFDPVRWIGAYPNPAFRNETPADRAWAARKIAAFTDDDIRAIVATGQYSDPRAEEWIARCLSERRDKIVAAYLGGMAALDGFDVHDGRLEWSHSGRGAAPDPQIRWFQFDNTTGKREPVGHEGTRIVPDGGSGTGYLVAELTDHASPSIRIYLRAKSAATFVVGVERIYAGGGAHVVD